jgi:hypothetical protein
MKTKVQGIGAAVAIFALGAVAGHAMTSSYTVSDAAIIAQISPFELTIKAVNLPVQTADAI